MLARLTTTATSIAIPAETFAGATFVTFSLTAIQSTNTYASGVLVENDLPLTTATAITGMFRLSATCGDGQLDPGEACDTTSASATCDVDCTPVLCGDGLTNAAAGEACDTIDNTLACDRDCTLAACGDGRINPTREDCDDGDAIDSGDGCSAACKFNNVCGDGVVQAAVEDCDAGGDTAQCDADCTRNLDKYAYLASPDEIAENDYNLNIPRYVDTFEEEAEIDLMAVRAEREQLKTELAVLEERMATYLKELGYE